MLEEAQAIKEQLIQWRRTIHRHPELRFEVHRTAQLVADALADIGVQVRTGVGKTGVVGTLGAEGGPTIAIRADMDGLPIQEENQVEYASQVPGCMHACGHDAHTAMLLGVALLLSRQELPGQVRLLFQPSEEGADEEGVSGASRMIADGALEGVDVVMAQHVDATLNTGTIMVGEGWVSAAVDSFKARIIGRGGHGAFPHQTLDPIWLTSNVLNALYAIPSRRIKPLEPCVVTVGVIQAGTASNIIPDSVTIEGTLRSFDDGLREQLIEEVGTAMATARALGGDYQLEIGPGYPASYNDPIVADRLRQVGSDLLGQERVGAKQKAMGSEDFSYMTQLAKGAMMRLGVTPAGGQARPAHSATFDIDEEALPVGAAVLAEAARRFVTGQFRLD